MNRRMPGIPVHHQLLEFTQTHVHWVIDAIHLILCCPLLLLPPFPPSIRVFSNESTLHMRWPKYWSFSFSISPSNEHPGLISFRMDLLDLLALQWTLKSLLQHHSSKESILRHSDIHYLNPPLLWKHNIASFWGPRCGLCFRGSYWAYYKIFFRDMLPGDLKSLYDGNTKPPYLPPLPPVQPVCRSRSNS